MEKRAFTHLPNALLPGAGFVEENLAAPDAAIAEFFARVAMPPPTSENVALDAAGGRILAVHIDADRNYPAAARSAMDGFAVAAAQTPGRLRILGEIRMGNPWSGRLQPGTALRIPTGGVVPAGADGVVPIEDARVEGDFVSIDRPVAPGDSIVHAGADMRSGEPVLRAGQRLRSGELGVLAALGIAGVPVFRRPRIAVLSSGDELIGVAQSPEPGQIRDSNRYAIAESLRVLGALPVHIPSVRDEPGALEASLRSALEGCGGAIVSAGSSVGERDLTPGAIAALGAPGVVVHGLRIKPGKPTVLGAVGCKPVIGLPGNPASAAIVLQAVVAPILAALAGAALAPPPVLARLTAPLESRLGWTWYLPVVLGDEPSSLVAHPLSLRSSAVSLTARASGYVIMDERQEFFAPGTCVEVHRLY